MGAHSLAALGASTTTTSTSRGVSVARGHGGCSSSSLGARPAPRPLFRACSAAVGSSSGKARVWPLDQAWSTALDPQACVKGGGRRHV